LRYILSLALVWVCLLAATAGGVVLHPDKPNAVSFPAVEARFVRFVIHASSGSQACIDELEIYAPGGEANLALAVSGGKASASSCLGGYAIHKIPHLNDGLYGNAHSWIAAGGGVEWAQIELPRAVKVSKVIFSRDRKGRYRDRLPLHFELRVSLDGKQWKTVSTVKAANARRKPPVARGRTPWSDFSIPTPQAVGALDTSNSTVSGALGNGDVLGYAFLCEARTSAKVDRSDPTERVLKQLSEMIERLAGKSVDVSADRGRLVKFRRRHKASATDEVKRSLFFEARGAKRRLMLRDPDLKTLGRILFTKRHPYLPSHNYSVILDAKFRGGGGVCVLDIPRSDGRLVPDKAKLTVLFDGKEGIVRDAKPNFDASKIYFAWRESVKGYWSIYEIDAAGGAPRKLTDGPFHDYYPCPLPDGGLAFTSTRCKARFLCWRPQAFVLFRMDGDGYNIRPLSHANISEWTPSVMRDGRIIWMRSEYLDKGANFGHTLWSIRPDGTHPELVFGNNTPNCYANGRQVPGTSELSCTLVSHGGDLNGPVALIDPAKGRSNPAAVRSITPDVPAQYHMSWIKKECFRDPVPVSRDYFLCSHAPDDRFGLYVIDRYGNRELLYFDPSIASMCPELLRPIRRPTTLSSPEYMAKRRGPGQFVVVDVHKGLGASVKPGAIKYIRVCQEVRSDLVRLPDGAYKNDHPPFQDYYATPVHKVSGPNGWPTYVAKASLGLAEVSADGSANFLAPAGKVLYFQALDANLNEVQRMRSVVQLQPGEKRGCIGCHEARDTAPPRSSARPLAMLREARPLDPPPWGTGAMSYERVVQPVLDAKCVRCHDEKHKRKINLTGKLDAHRVPASYRTLVSGGLVHHFNMAYNQMHRKAAPLTFGSVKSKLIKTIESGHPPSPATPKKRIKLTRSETRRIKCWIDMNCPLWGDYTYRLNRPTKLTRTTK
jgi:hypothetical protein